MKSTLRLAATGIVIAGMLFGGAGPASATCHPEKPSTCEPEFPPINPEPEPSCQVTITLPNGGSTTLYYC